MKKLLFLVSMLTCCISHANISIQLKKLSNTKQCQNIDQWTTSDNVGKLDKFSIPDGDYLTITLSDFKRNSCYSFEYFPSVSPYIKLSIKNKKLIINEIVGSTLNGHQITHSYSIDLKDKKLILIRSETMTFDRDEDGNLIKVVSNLLEK